MIVLNVIARTFLMEGRFLETLSTQLEEHVQQLTC